MLSACDKMYISGVHSVPEIEHQLDTCLHGIVGILPANITPLPDEINHATVERIQAEYNKQFISSKWAFAEDHRRVLVVIRDRFDGFVQRSDYANAALMGRVMLTDLIGLVEKIHCNDQLMLKRLILSMVVAMWQGLQASGDILFRALFVHDPETRVLVAAINACADLSEEIVMEAISVLMRLDPTLKGVRFHARVYAAVLRICKDGRSHQYIIMLQELLRLASPSVSKFLAESLKLKPLGDPTPSDRVSNGTKQIRKWVEEIRYTKSSNNDHAAAHDFSLRNSANQGVD